MKSFEKIMKVVPITGISTAILLSPGFAFAAEKGKTTQVQESAINSVVKSGTGINVDVKTIKDDLVERIAFLSKTDNALTDLAVKTIIRGAVNGWAPQFENVSPDIKLTDVTIDKYIDDSIELGSYSNPTKDPQTFQTPSKTEEVEDSFTYSNAEGVKIGVSSETKLGLEIPFVAKGGETITISSEFTYDHTSSNTTTHKTSVTYPSQTLVCAPGYKTSLIIKTSKAQFSGTMGMDAKITNVDQLNWNLPQSMDLYTVYKKTSSTIPLPSYITLDAAHQTVLFKKKIPFSGVAGHLTAAEASQVKLESLDGTKKAITMSLQQYKDPQIRAKLLKN
ncbi:hypothetical protein BT246_70880 (plasmid) [Bacillus thuringiensis]|uniref:Uncharacterized protein n=1 Tax=Bacillus thuringiensis TaxID=1428 RepID=A0A9W3SJL3_BACTU|nr:ETX/MTX2 family pore-forming toxin [Bacillus thuringiensis]ANS52378.1 hypothetical protein BT246_70880 [Bacillus thuringiensis]